MILTLVFGGKREQKEIKMKYSRKMVTVLCYLTLIFSLVACTSPTNNPSAFNDANLLTTSVEGEKTAVEDVQTSVTEVLQTSTGVTEYPLTITDSEDHVITFEIEPTKVVSMAPNITEIIYQLGLQSKLVGRTDYCDYPQEVLNIESVGTMRSPDIEKIVSLEPDVVIASTHFSEEATSKLTSLGIKVIILYEQHEIEGVYSTIETIGTIFNVKESASTTVNEMKTSIANTITHIEGLDKPSVYYVVGFGEYGDYTAGGDTFISQMITLAGGNNIAQNLSGWSYSLESLVEADPDIIIIPEEMKADFEIAPNYKDLTAVKKHRVFGINKNLLERQGICNAEGVRVLAEIIHPEGFK